VYSIPVYPEHLRPTFDWDADRRPRGDEYVYSHSAVGPEASLSGAFASTPSMSNQQPHPEHVGRNVKAPHKRARDASPFSADKRHKFTRRSQSPHRSHFGASPQFEEITSEQNVGLSAIDPHSRVPGIFAYMFPYKCGPLFIIFLPLPLRSCRKNQRAPSLRPRKLSRQSNRPSQPSHSKDLHGRRVFSVSWSPLTPIMVLQQMGRPEFTLSQPCRG
jgi:hypothetical protein